MNYLGRVRSGVEESVGERADRMVPLWAFAAIVSLGCAIAGIFPPITSISAAVFAFLVGRSLRADTNASVSAPDLDKEIERARRSERGFALVDLSGLAGRVPLEQLRSTDSVINLDGRSMLVMPEADHEHVRILASRVTEPAGIDSLMTRTVYFPEDGLTADALLNRSSSARTGERR